MTAHKAPRMPDKARVLLATLATFPEPTTTTALYAACYVFKDTTQVAQFLGNWRDARGYVKSEPGVGKSLLWSITQAGRDALAAAADDAPAPARAPQKTSAQKRRAQALAAPTIDPGHTDAEGDEEEEEAHADFALWASGQLAIESADGTTIALHGEDVGRLRDYLNEHAPKARAFCLTSFDLDADSDAFMRAELASGAFKPDKFRQFIQSTFDGVREPGPSTSAPNPAPTAAAPVAPTAAVAPSPAPAAEYVVAATLDVARALATMPRPHDAALNCDYSAATEAIGLPGVELDGPRGIGGMSRADQFAEAAARG